MVNATGYPYDPIINKDKWNLYSWVKDVYMGTPLVYFNSTQSEKYKLVTKVCGPSNAYKVSTLAFTRITCQEFPPGSFTIFYIVFREMNFFLPINIFEQEVLCHLVLQSS